MNTCRCCERCRNFDWVLVRFGLSVCSSEGLFELPSQFSWRVLGQPAAAKRGVRRRRCNPRPAGQNAFRKVHISYRIIYCVTPRVRFCSLHVHAPAVRNYYSTMYMKFKCTLRCICRSLHRCFVEIRVSKPVTVYAVVTLTDILKLCRQHCWIPTSHSSARA